MGVQCSGSMFPSSVPGVSPLDWCSICVCRQWLYHEAHSPPVTDTVYATKQHCRGSPQHYISRVLQSPLPCPNEVRSMETSHSTLHDGECRKHSAISPSRRLDHFQRSCGCLFPHTHPQRLPTISSISDSGHHIPIPGTIVWPFSSTLGIDQNYDRDQNAGTRDGHQSLSVPGRVTHLFTISRPVCGYHFPPGGGRSPMVEVSTQGSEGSPSYPDRTRHPVVHRCIGHRLGCTLECIDGIRCMDNN